MVDRKARIKIAELLRHLAGVISDIMIMNKNYKTVLIMFVLSAIIFASVVFVVETEAVESDIHISYLMPEEGMFGFAMHDQYFMAVSERLLTKRYRKCQAVFLPSFSAESAVYLNYDRDNHKAKPVVVSVILEHQLWHEMNKVMEKDADFQKTYSTGLDAQRKALVQIRSEVDKAEAPIDATIANTLELLWDAMLTRVKYPEKGNIGLDGETCHFANFTIKIGYRTGWAWSPDTGTLTYEFVELAKDLRAYPRLRDTERTNAAEAMLKKAKTLLFRMESSK